MAGILKFIPTCSLVIFISLISCNNRVNYIDQHVQLKSMSMEDLWLFAYNYRADSIFFYICDALNDSIINGEMAWYEKIIYIDEDNEEISWRFIKKEYPIPSVNKRLLFEICITGSESILINCDKASISEIRYLAEEFIFHPDSLDKQIILTKRSFDFFGELEVSRATAIVSANVVGKNGLSYEEWSTFFNCIDEIVKLSENLRDQISMEKWNKDFASLPFEKKVVVSLIVGSRVTLLLNAPCCSEVSP
jgi:hypothetical protein